MSREPYPPEIELSRPVRRVIMAILSVGACCGIGLWLWVNFGENMGYVLLSVLGAGLCCRMGIWLWSHIARRGRQLILTTLVVGAFLNVFIWIWLDTSENARRVFLTVVAYGVCCGIGSWVWTNVSQRTHRLIITLCVVGICSGISIWLWPNIAESKRQQHDLQLRAQIPFRFPYAELVALDRDLQRRFAVIPDKDFGMSRVGVSHGLYVPISSEERTTISALQKRKLQVAFYVMSRRAWLYKQMPIQGPVYLNPPPYGFVGREVEGDSYVLGEDGKFKLYDHARFSDPDGHRIASPPMPPDLPKNIDFYGLGGQIFTIAGAGSAQVLVGESKFLHHGRWQVSAVPIRASREACVNCHNAMRPQDKKLAIGDTVGVAFYTYRPTAR